MTVFHFRQTQRFQESSICCRPPCRFSVAGGCISDNLSVRTVHRIPAPDHDCDRRLRHNTYGGQCGAHRGRHNEEKCVKAPGAATAFLCNADIGAYPDIASRNLDYTRASGFPVRSGCLGAGNLQTKAGKDIDRLSFSVLRCTATHLRRRHLSVSTQDDSHAWRFFKRYDTTLLKFSENVHRRIVDRHLPDSEDRDIWFGKQCQGKRRYQRCTGKQWQRQVL